MVHERLVCAEEVSVVKKNEGRGGGGVKKPDGAEDGVRIGRRAMRGVCGLGDGNLDAVATTSNLYEKDGIVHVLNDVEEFFCFFFFSFLRANGKICLNSNVCSVCLGTQEAYLLLSCVCLQEFVSSIGGL